MRWYQEDHERRMRLEEISQGRYGYGAGQRARRHDPQAAMPAVWQNAGPAAARAVRRRAGPVAAYFGLLFLDAAAAFSPSYRPSARSTVTPYLGHSFSFLRSFVDVRPQVVLAALNEGVRLAGIL